MSGASSSGNILSLPDLGNFGMSFFNGVLRFPGPVTTLSMNAAAFNGSGQFLTFAIDASPIPEPSSVVLLGVGLVGITCLSYAKNSLLKIALQERSIVLPTSLID